MRGHRWNIVGTRTSARVLTAIVGAGTVIALAAAPGGAITNGQPDEGRHPYVGGTVLDFPPFGKAFVNCTGSLISDRIFLTSAHCWEHERRVSVAFDEVFDPDTSPRHEGTFVAHPAYKPAQWSRNDVAVVVLDVPVTGIDPERLPRLPDGGLLDGMKADGALNKGNQFTSVGYGFRGFSKGGGPQRPVVGQARYVAVGSYNSLDRDQLHLSQNRSHGDGGTCNGDSGGPNFLGAGAEETLVIAGLTAAGDTHCNSTNVAYRLDTTAARSFLGQFVTLS